MTLGERSRCLRPVPCSETTKGGQCSESTPAKLLVAWIKGTERRRSSVPDRKNGLDKNICFCEYFCYYLISINAKHK